jgi:hypothetical protein
MTVQITSLSRLTTEDDLQVLEQELGTKLPQDYRQFLFKYNCAEVTPNCFLMNDKKGYDEGYNSVRYLFGLCDPDWCSLRYYQKEYAHRMPNNLLPIGADEDSSYLCLSIIGDDYGKVYFWDRHFEVFEGEPDHSNVWQVADSFTEFINSLKTCAEIEK